MADDRKVAVLGAGVIGASWTALFLASGCRVSVYDPAEDTERSVRAYLDTAWPTLRQLGLAAAETPGEPSFHATPAEAVEGAGFVQENVPERLPIKRDLYAAIEPALSDGAIVASSTSGLGLSEMQSGWRDPSRFVLGHPFNPPHLIPLVEIMGNERTAPGVLESAERFYRAVGKVTIRLRREVPGHVANRLQAALWREAIHLMMIGAASVEDIDTAIWAGPGLRWAAMGPTMLFHLGAGEGGLGAFCERYAESFHRWWDDLGTVRLDPDTIAQLSAGIAEEAGSRSRAELSAERDALIAALLTTTSRLRQG
jgi:3-hydroxybutyryl-CoA dehydrogenase